ncbi:MAG: ATP-binding protein [Clostridium sp.]
MGRLVDMRPEKDVIVNALIKDATLETAIFEFIDNSIKAAKKNGVNGRLDSFFIKINIGKNEKIEIIDNCGGMDREQFISKVFRFGNSYDTKDEGYGIGMKRALFKLAERFEVISYGDNGKFKICLNVKEWLKTDDWNANMEEVKISERAVGNGVQIKIDKINENIKQLLKDKGVIVDLIKKGGLL